MAMFPLGTVLVPGGFLPLHGFEARYHVLMFGCRRGDRECGVAAGAGKGGEAPLTAPVELTGDPVTAGWQLVAAAPVGTLEKQRLLAVDDHTERLGALTVMAQEQASLLAYRLDRE